MSSTSYMNPLDTPGQAFALELMNPNPGSKRLKDGARYWVRFEVTKEIHDAFMEARESNLRLVGYLSVLGDTDETVKLTPEKGPHGHFWSALFAAGFYNCPGVREALQAEQDEDDAYLTPEMEAGNTSPAERAKVLFRRIFKTDSLTLISPDTVESHFFENPQALTMIGQAKRRVTT